jgi:cytochrome c oxidase cbb3-type subunit 1
LPLAATRLLAYPATSFYVRPAHLRRAIATSFLWGGNLAWFVFWGYQLFIVMAATGYLLGITQGREYAEPNGMSTCG